MSKRDLNKIHIVLQKDPSSIGNNVDFSKSAFTVMSTYYKTELIKTLYVSLARLLRTSLNAGMSITLYVHIRRME